MEKMLVAQALDERDLLKKKIIDKISNCKFVTVCKEKDENINSTPIDKIAEDIKSDWQSIRDMIDRYDRINRAIILSNAQTIIKFKDGTEMTKAEAISLKSSKKTYNFDLQIIRDATTAYNESIRKAAFIEQQQNQSREQHITSMLNGTDKKVLDEDSIKIIDGFVKPFAPKWIDPLNIKEEIDKLTEKVNAFNSEVETLLKVSNATTEIEF